MFIELFAHKRCDRAARWQEFGTVGPHRDVGGNSKTAPLCDETVPERRSGR